MACTTILVGKNATNDGSTIIARNEDCENGTFNAKSMVVVQPKDQPKKYTGINSHLTIKLPDNPLRYTCTPNTDNSDGVWGEAGINAANVAMSATETISANSRVLGADPLVAYIPETGKRGRAGYKAERPGGIGEEDLVTIILPYIHTAREGVERMGALLEEYGTYETNGVMFADENDVWYIESIGGHHWIARRVPDDCYVVQPNRQGIDTFDLSDAMGDKVSHMCSPDMPEWLDKNHLVMDMKTTDQPRSAVGFMKQAKKNDPDSPEHFTFNARKAFSTESWLDTIYNCPRKWDLCKRLNPTSAMFSGASPKYGPESLDIPWAIKPESRISVDEVKNLLSTTYDGTEYDCYGTKGTPETRHMYRTVGINRTCECSVLTIRGYAPEAAKAVQWVAFGSGPFNTSIAILTNVNELPEYLNTGLEVSTDKHYWQNRLIAGLADPEFFENYESILSYQQDTMALGFESVAAADTKLARVKSADKAAKTLQDLNQKLCDDIDAMTRKLLGEVLFTRSLHMENAFGSNDH